MKELEERIKKEYDNMKLPDTDMAALVKARIEEDRDKCLAKGIKRMSGLAGRIAAVAATLLLVVCSSGTIYAVVKGLTPGQMFTMIWNGKVPERIQDTISCEAVIIKEKNTFENVEINPVRVIGDVRGLYVILEVTSNESEDIEMFREYDISYDEGGSASFSMQLLGKTDNTSYIALNYIGGADGMDVAESGKVEISLRDWCRYDGLDDGEPYILDGYCGKAENEYLIKKGEYSTVITYDYISDNIVIMKNDCNYNVSALTVMMATTDKKTYDSLMENSDYLNVKLNDGSEVEGVIDYSIENDGVYSIICRMSVPVEPENVVDFKWEVYENEKDN